MNYIFSGLEAYDLGEYHINGGKKLSGEVCISGGKNAVLPILAATVLVTGISTIHNCPKITDVYISIKILESLGCKVKWEGNSLIVDSGTLNGSHPPDDLVREMRSSVIFLGGLIGRVGKATITHPGGCDNFWRIIPRCDKIYQLL